VNTARITVTSEATADLEPLAPLWRSMVDHHRHVTAGDLPIRGAHEAWTLRQEEYRRWLRDGSGTLVRAHHEESAGPGSALGGYAFLRTVRSGPTFDFGDPRGEVESLVVAPAARGAGIGTALLRAARDELLRLGCTYWSVSVMEANEGAVRLYEQAGFRPWLRDLAAPL
jgi:ribosomal protein S18 acetylase RimI-like enzyme